MIKRARIAVDHGNKNVKTTHHVFTTGVEVSDLRPGRGTTYLEYEGRYYTLTTQRMPYQRDKTKDMRFFALTLIAIAKELEGISKVETGDIVQVQLPIGLPPKHFAELYERYERYFKGNSGIIHFAYNGRAYDISIVDVMAFPQNYAALMTRVEEIGEIPRVVGLDIGGFTTDYLLLRNGELDMSFCDSMENGIINLYNTIISKLRSEYDILLEDADIDSIIQGKTQYYEDKVVLSVKRQVQDFVTDLLSMLRERGIDTRSTYMVFIGGGSMLLKDYISNSDKLEKYCFLEDICANAKGYDLLYQLQERDADE
ncbi:MAG: ParM/StbA family protein [Hespellia sp.]|nr:ParM/StbA family protein [Hespellia sp.]